MARKWVEFADFYSSDYHARNVGKMFRDPENALLPNWKHLPVGYHGRSSSIIGSGEPVYRSSGQRKEADGSITFGPTRKLDFELEVGYELLQMQLEADLAKQNSTSGCAHPSARLTSG